MNTLIKFILSRSAVLRKIYVAHLWVLTLPLVQNIKIIIAKIILFTIVIAMVVLIYSIGWDKVGAVWLSSLQNGMEVNLPLLLSSLSLIPTTVNLERGKWQEVSYYYDNLLLSQTNLSKHLGRFRSEVLTKLDSDEFILLMIKFKYFKGGYWTLAPMQKLNNSSKDHQRLLKFLGHCIDLKADDYKTAPLNKVIFGFLIIPKDQLKDKISRIGWRRVEGDSTEVSKFEFKGYKLPASMDYTSWGHVAGDSETLSTVVDLQQHRHYVIHKTMDDFDLATHKVEVYGDGSMIIDWKDIQTDPFDMDTFTRVIRNQHYHFVDGEMVVKVLARKAKFLSPIKSDKRLNPKIITLDLETYLVPDSGEELMLPYCVSYFAGETNELKSFYLTDYSSVDVLMLSALESLFEKKYHNHKVYIHNLSQFDGVFLLKYLSKFEGMVIKPVMRSDKIIQLNCRFKGIKISFRDSLLMLPASLASLCLSFDVEISKDIFPYQFVTPDTLGYTGEVPDFCYFNKNKVTEKAYKEYAALYADKDWDMRTVTIDYCQKDCISLHQVITAFQKLIFERYGLDAMKYATIPSLTFAIFRAKYLGDTKIPLIVGNIYNDIKNSYTGGSTDMFKPHGRNVYAYDVNSLYPHVMAENPMPVGNPKYFEGDILRVDPDAFGFFHVEITAPEHRKYPILQTRTRTSGGIRTISPLGTWTDCLFSEEIKNAADFGYSFKVLSGYLFEAANIFAPFVKEIYGMKSSAPKGSAMYLIAKLLMNSLYGRFGMDPLAPDHDIIDVGELQSILSRYDITELAHFDSGDKVLIAFEDVSKLEKDTSLLDADTNVSVPIASAVTAYGRIEMSRYKVNSADILYTDTDSLYMSHPLPDHMVSDTELGKLKLEAIFKEAVFLAPKVYGGVLVSGKELVKIKGSKLKVPFRVLKSLLYRDSKHRLTHTKWFRNWSKGYITVKPQLYTLSATDNKRRLFFKNNKLIGTKPYILKGEKRITSLRKRVLINRRDKVSSLIN